MSKDATVTDARRRWAGLGLVLSSVLLLLLGGIAWLGHAVARADLPAWIGNRPEQLEHIARTDPCDFTFLVVGDAKHGVATLERLLELGRRDRAAFMVVVGDFASDSRNVEHRFFAWRMGRQPASLPLVLAPGNHEIAPDDEFAREDFVRQYGADQFAFRIGPYLFVVLNNVPPYDAEADYIDFLDRAVADQPTPPEKTFVFMHVPPGGLSDQILARGVAHSQAFLDRAEVLGVDYVFMGDHHGHVKVERGPTTYLVCGGGGSPLRGPHGRFHHAVRIAVHDGAVTETVIAVDHQPEWLVLLERNAAVYAWPWIAGHNLTRALAVLAALVLAAWWLRSLADLRRDGPQPHASDQKP